MGIESMVVLRFEERIDPVSFISHLLSQGWVFSSDGAVAVLPPDRFQDGDWTDIGPVNNVEILELLRRYSDSGRDFAISVVREADFEGGPWHFSGNYREIMLVPPNTAYVECRSVKTLDTARYLSLIISVFEVFEEKPIEITFSQTLIW